MFYYAVISAFIPVKMSEFFEKYVRDIFRLSIPIQIVV
jgi:hypothetical protein